MIIICNNCNKNFDIDSSLIPEKGRLLQCNSCNHKWFFKNEITDKPLPIVRIKDPAEEPKLFKEEMVAFVPDTIEPLDNVSKDITIIKKIPIKDETEENEFKENNDQLEIKISKNKKKNSILGLIIVFIISLTALIIILDTFQKPISYMVPNIEFLLYSLYETINDIVLFFSDLI